MRILLSIDGSSPAEEAAAWVAGRRWAEGSTVRVLAVDDAYGEDRALLDDALERAAARVGQAGVAVERALRAGRAATLILAEAATWGADLVVVGSRGRGRIGSLLLGSVSTEVLERARAAVLVVRLPRMAGLLVAVDGSPPSREVAPFLCASGAVSDVPATVVSVSRDAEPWPPQLDASAARAATRAAAALARCGVEARREVLVGDPAAAILAAAAERGVDLVAVGSRGQSRLRGLLLGSVARNLASSAPCSVLVVRRPPGRSAR
ncbi:MAG TPA: universal stress protein [Candidatus Angelobacter sp.]|nr:universal stress protein [Candidatus Angelobacter sp.]